MNTLVLKGSLQQEQIKRNAENHQLSGPINDTRPDWRNPNYPNFVGKYKYLGTGKDY